MSKNIRKTFLYWLILALAIGAYSLLAANERGQADTGQTEISAEPASQASADTPPADRKMSLPIEERSTYGELMRSHGLDYGLAMAIHAASLPVYDLAQIRQGRTLDLVFDGQSDDLKELRYQIDTEEYVFVRPDPEKASSSDPLVAAYWQAERSAIPYEIRRRTAGGTIETSMYEAAASADIDIRAIIELANAFQWSIDFAMDPRVGDTFKFIYEERFLDGEYVMPGQILAGRYVNDGTASDVYYFEENKDNTGFFDAEGRSVQKMFLKAPVEFKYISSGYTTGNRVIMEYGLSGPHLAIDYAAPAGTPIRSVGDGTVAYAGWKTGYGNIVSIRHNGTYATNYAHQSKIAVKTGQKVKQGQTIGYVGSTGYSTGPHLHYEMVKNGAKINPQKEVLPPGEPIKPENMERFFAAIGEWQRELGE